MQDHSELIDIRNVKINAALPQEERIRSFVEQIKNPYRFMVGDVIVSVSYAKTDSTLNDCFTDLLSIMT